MSEFDISNLSYYLNQFDELNPYDFEDMVAQMLRCKGWTNIELTSRTADKGRDIIGCDQKGKKVYIEVKHHREKIGRPIIQKLHSIMVTEDVEKGMVIITSDFTPEAQEYARTSNIKLMNGKKFIETCQYLISSAPRSDSLCTPINLEGFLAKARNLVDLNIFSYPKSTSEFIQKEKYFPFRYNPYSMVIVSVDQDFQNKSGSFYYHMYYQKMPFIFSNDGDFLNDKFMDVRFENTIDLKNVERLLTKNDLIYEKKAHPPINYNKLKKFIQRACTTKRSYRGQNNQIYTRTCRPNLNNIEIHRVYKYWQLFTALDLKVDKFTRFRAFIKDDKFTKFVAVDYPTTKQNPKELRMCQSCKALIFKGAPKNKFSVCQGCGMILCKECIHEGKWCLNCAKKIEYGTLDRKKNSEALKSYKTEYRKWRRNKNPFKMEFLSS